MDVGRVPPEYASLVIQLASIPATAALAAILLAAGPQAAPPSTAKPAANESKAPPTAPPPQQTTPASGPATAVPEATSESRKRPPLLREGSYLSRVEGHLRLDETRSEWLFVPTARERGGLQRELTLLPCEPLAEAVRTFRLSPSPMVFEATGQVFIYHGRNYLLPSMIVSNVAPQAPSPAAPSGAAPAKPAAANADRPIGASDEEAIAEEMERKLAERIATVPKAPAVAPPASGDAKGGPAPVSKVSIQSRRGHLVRDAATGGWRFVFEAQNNDGNETSMQVLPCLALERVEKSVRESDGQLALVVTGITTVYEGRTFLLPGVFRLATGGKGINP